MSPYERFLTAHPDYAGTAALDGLRQRDYGRLDAQGQVYLDYTGGGLHAASQLREHMELLDGEVFGNPHSASPSSSAMTRRVESARAAVLAHFNAGDDYTAVFTQNASGALKLVAESFPFEPGSRLLLTADNHNSVNGMREFACAKGAQLDYAPLTRPELRIDRAALTALLRLQAGARASLLALPAQSNFSGVKHPLELVAQAQAAGWRVMLDAAAYAPTNTLDLRAVRPDFVALSFYKLFGYPTGVGALLLRKDALALLRRPWFAGGTVNFASAQGALHVLSAGEAGFEDGTLNYLSLPAVEIGLRHLQRVGMDRIQTRVRCLTAALLDDLLALRHGNGKPMVRLYGPANTVDRGGTVTMNFYDPEEQLLDYRRVEELAAAQGISLRTGCFCNPGAGETAEDLSADDMRAAQTLGAAVTLSRFVQLMQGRGGKSAGALRVSFGLVSNHADLQRFVDFAAGLRDQTTLTLGPVRFDIESCRVVRDGA